jgi:isopenicillin N synthase-like dioxygenase
MSIPVIDLTAACAGDLDPAAAAVGAAIGDVGFFQVVGHGIPPAVIDAVHDARQRLGVPDPEAQAVLASPHPFRGWRFLPSGVERFQVCAIGSVDDAHAAGIDPRFDDYFVPNLWPELDGFREAVGAMFDATRQLAALVMQLFARSLDLPPDHFDPVLQHDVSCFAINHYPAMVERPDGPSLAEHADSGTLTLLHQRGDHEGLRLRFRDGSTTMVPVLDEAFVVNIGHLMARWTNGRFRATPHCVIPPADPTGERTSLTTFHLPAIDTVVAPLPACIGDDGPLFEPVTPYEWESRFLATLSATTYEAR